MDWSSIDINEWYRKMYALNNGKCENCGVEFIDLPPQANLWPHWKDECNPLSPSQPIQLTNNNIEKNKVKSNLLEVNHVANDGTIRELIFNLDNIKISSIGDVKNNYPVMSVIHWYIPGNPDENFTHTIHSLKELKEKLFGAEE